MDDKKIIFKTFISQLEEFFNDMEQIFPKDDDLKYCKNTMNLVKKANPKKLIEGWYTNISSKYYNEINNGNVKYFLEKDFDEDIKNIKMNKISYININSTNYMFKMIDKIKTNIKSMNNDNMEKSVQYIKNLTNLSTIYYN